ncbi:MAG TPA: hypothetical protein VJ717_11020, partial [Gemmatimonadaceae bacterium]|nr:hypothetical protein [Gemmatimonadaceae bacterium]
TTAMEWIAHLGNMRGRLLEEGTKRLLGEDREPAAPFTDAFYNHALMRDLSDGKRRPSYVPSKVFARALRDVVRDREAVATEGAAPAAPAIPIRLRESLHALAEPDTTQLDAKERAVGTRVELPAVPALADWFDQAMDRLSGDYKRRTRWIVLVLAALITIVMNADTVDLTRNLWQNPTLRAYLVERAKIRVEQGPPLETVEYTEPENPQPTPTVPDDTTGRNPDRLLAEEQALLGQLFGWGNEGEERRRLGTFVWFIKHLLGWTLTALAVSLGAPFWFDTLQRIMRATGKVPPKYQNDTART